MRFEDVVHSIGGISSAVGFASFAVLGNWAAAAWALIAFAWVLSSWCYARLAD